MSMFTCLVFKPWGGAMYFFFGSFLVFLDLFPTDSTDLTDIFGIFWLYIKSVQSVPSVGGFLFLRGRSGLHVGCCLPRRYVDGLGLPRKYPVITMWLDRISLPSFNFCRVALTLWRFLNFCRETFETLRLLHLIDSFIASYKVSPRCQSLKVLSIFPAFNSVIASSHSFFRIIFGLFGLYWYT